MASAARPTRTPVRMKLTCHLRRLHPPTSWYRCCSWQCSSYGRASDAAGATAAGAGEDDADARAAALPYLRGVTVVPTGEDEADAPPV